MIPSKQLAAKLVALASFLVHGGNNRGHASFN